MLIGLQNLEKDFGEAVILKGITANVEQGDRIGIVGENGAGKTTLLRMLCGEYQPDAGELTIVHGVMLGYLEQNSKLDPTLDVYGEMRKAFQPVLDAMARMQVVEKQLALHPEADGREELLEEHAHLSAVVDAADGYNMDIQIKKVLNGMAFGPETYDKRVAVLSGGEQTRLRLAKLLLQHPDVLILDEPTNHLDIASREWIEEAVEAYDGTLLFVSHDRYFINRFATRIWEVANGTITDYPMGFAQYRQVKAQEEAEKTEAPKPVKEKTVTEKPVRGDRAQQAARRQLTICEREIAKAEERIGALDAEMEANACDYEKLNALVADKDAAQAELDALYLRWEELSEAAGEA